MDIGNKIKLLRHKIGATQEQLGEKIGVSAQSISKWETGVTMPDITLLPTLSSELGVTIDELFDLTVEQKLQRIDGSSLFAIHAVPPFLIINAAVRSRRSGRRPWLPPRS